MLEQQQRVMDPSFSGGSDKDCSIQIRCETDDDNVHSSEQMSRRSDQEEESHPKRLKLDAIAKQGTC